MPSRIATGPTGVTESIRARIRSDPSILEEGLRILDHDLKAGGAGIIDAIGVDRAGGLAIVSIAPGDLDRALLQILDLHLWTTDRLDLLARLYAGHGVVADRPIRVLLLAPAFTHAFLRRLALLAMDVTPLLAREVALGDGPRIAIEPAAHLFGLTASSPEKSNGRDEQAPPAGGRPFWPDEVLPAQEGDRNALAFEPAPESSEPAWPDSPDDRFPWEIPDDPLAAPVDALSPPAAPDGAFETLSVEEMQEFERFEKQRRERDGRSS